MNSEFQIDGYILRKYMGCSGDVVIPDGVIFIGEKAFAECGSITSIKIPSSVKRIGEWAFWKCSGLLSINIPSSVKIIEKAAFENCYALADVTIPSSIICIEEALFYDCRSLKDITLPASVTSIETKAFKHSGLERITILSPNIKIASKSFEFCHIKEVRLSRYAQIDKGMFSPFNDDTKLVSIKLKNSEK